MGIESLNTNYYGYALQSEKSKKGLPDFPVSAFYNYFPASDPFGSPNDDDDMDFMSRLIKQQQKLLALLYQNSMPKFDIGLTNVANKQKGFLGLGKRTVHQELSKDCKTQIDEMAQELKMNPKDIESLIYSESGGNPQAVNPDGNATGF